MSSHTNTPHFSSDDEIDLFELAEDLWQQKWLVLGVTFVVTSLAMAYALLATPVYQASVRLMPPNAGDVVPFNLGRVQAGLTGLDPDSAYALFRRSLTSQTTRRWFREEYYRPYLREKGVHPNQEELALQMARVLVVRHLYESDSSAHQVTVNIDQPELAAEWASAYVEKAAARARQSLETRASLEILNRRTELEQRIDVLRRSTLDQRKDRIARLKEALQVAEAVGFDAPQVTHGQVAAETDLAQILDGNLLYMRGSKAIRSELALLESRKDDDPFIADLRGLERQINLLDLIGPVPSTVQLFTVDSAADVPDRPVKPKKAVVVVFGGLLGGMLGGMIALARITIGRRYRRKVAPAL